MEVEDFRDRPMYLHADITMMPMSHIGKILLIYIGNICS